MKVFLCNGCGHVEFNEAPGQCPVCGSTSFTQNDSIFKESEEKSSEAAHKHIPAVSLSDTCSFIPEKECNDVNVRIGETLHPMQDNHYIRFIDCYVDDTYVGQKKLTPGLYPASCFHLQEKGSKVTIVENCNVHGYWMKETSL